MSVQPEFEPSFTNLKFRVPECPYLPWRTSRELFSPLNSKLPEGTMCFTNLNNQALSYELGIERLGICLSGAHNISREIDT